MSCSRTQQHAPGEDRTSTLRSKSLHLFFLLISGSVKLTCKELSPRYIPIILLPEDSTHPNHPVQWETYKPNTPPLYNTIIGGQANFCVSFIGKSVFDDHLGSNNDMCYIQNRVITNCVIKKYRCTIRIRWKVYDIREPGHRKCF